MKKNKLVLSTLTIALGATLIAPNALAASKGSTTSKGVAGFTTSTNVDNDIQIPEVVPEVTVRPPYTGGDNELQTGEGLALFVPDFDFGRDEIKQEKQLLNVKPVQYTNTDSTATVQNYYLPPMIIVKDQRGGGTSTWSVKVWNSEFTNTSGHTLKGATIRMNDALVFNSAKPSGTGGIPTTSDQNVTSDPDFVVPTTPFVFPTKSTEAAIILASKTKGAFQTTLVPDTSANYEDFKATAASKSKYSATDQLPSVQLEVPAATIRQASTYTSTITWELFDTADGK